MSAPLAPARMQRANGHASLAVKAGPSGRTVVDRLHQYANAKIRMPRLHGPALEAVLINTAGGLTGGDHLAWSFAAAAGTRLVVTTQAAERIYRSAGGPAVQHTSLSLGAGARADWLPQETILFEESALHRSLDADLSEGASLLAAETLVFGRKAMGETVSRLALRDRWRIRRQGRLVHAESVSLGDDVARLLALASVASHRCAVATIVLVPAGEETVAAHAASIRAMLADLMPDEAVKAGVTALPGRLVVRLVAEDGYRLRPVVAGCLGLLRAGCELPAVWRS